MRCNCLEDLSARLKDHLKDQVRGPIESVRCTAEVYCFGEAVTTQLAIPFAIKADAPGYRSLKGKHLSVHASFCPFCGTPTKEPEPVAEAAPA